MKWENNLNLFILSPKYSNKQNLLFTILNNINDIYTIKFDIDNLIINNIKYLDILNGNCLHPDILKYKKTHNKVFFHQCYINLNNCLTINEYKNKFPNEYSKASRQKWLNDLTINKIKIHNIWTKEECHKKALLCKTRSEFQKLYNKYYLFARKNNWLDEICSHMILLKNIWTKEECHQKALLCNTRIEFQKNYTKYYQKALKENWLDEICSHMILLKNIWTKEHCKIEALKYETRSEFYYKSQNIYHIAYKNNWLDEICSHMILNNAYNYPREIYAYEFSDNHVYIGLTKNIEIRNKYRYKQQNDAVILHINKTNLTPKLIKLTELIPAKEAQIKEAEFINQYKENNWNILNKAKAGSLGGSYKKLIFDEI